MGRQLLGEVGEFGRAIGWYGGRKFSVFGAHFEGAKSLVVDVLKARRGTYQKPFLHTGMVFLMIVGAAGGPLLASQYPMAANAEVVTSSTPSGTVLGEQTDITNIDTETSESKKPRRDIVSYTVAPGDTLSVIAEKFSAEDNVVDVASIAYLNGISEKKVLKPGEVVKIPPIAGVVVTVKSGDTIQSLAKKYGLPTPQPIVDWAYNEFVNDETFSLAAGQTLVIPGGKPPAVAPVAPRVVKAPGQQLFSGGTGQFGWPTGGTITQYYAWYHSGVDIANKTGTAVTAADSGRVESVIYQNYGYGYHVIVNHGNGYKTLYGHLSKIGVSEGQNVSRGEVLGDMGSTGRSTGPHLHFEVLQNGARINPLGFLR